MELCEVIQVCSRGIIRISEFACETMVENLIKDIESRVGGTVTNIKCDNDEVPFSGTLQGYKKIVVFVMFDKK